MLAKRIIPVLLHRGPALYKGMQFSSWRQVGVAMQAVKVYQTRSVDELIMLDISATPLGKGPDLDMVSQLSSECFMPLTVGGGVSTIEHIRSLLLAGADKVAICTAAIEQPHLIRSAADLFGSQAIVVALDVKGTQLMTHCGMVPAVYGSGVDVVAYLAKMYEDLGAGELLLTSVDREGTMKGYDLDLIRAVASSVSVPVIANGGCGSLQDMHEAIIAGADAVAAGAMFQFNDVTPRDAARYLNERGIETRV